MTPNQAPGTLADDEAKTIRALIKLARSAWSLADNCEDGVKVDRKDFQALCDDLDVLDNLPKVEWALRRLLATTNAVPAQAEVVTGEAGEQCRVCGGDCAGANPPVINCPMQGRPATRPAASGDGGGAEDAGDAATLRGFIREFGMTPSMMASQASFEKKRAEKAEAALASMTAERDRLAAEWKTAYLAFKGAFDTPVSRRRQNDEYAVDARNRLRAFDAALASPQADAGERT